MSVAESKGMIEIIDKALVKLKSHPEYGDICFDIINANYISKTKMSDEEVLHRFHISSSTYYRYKRKAINLLGVILWGYILPSLRDIWSQCLVAESPSVFDNRGGYTG